MSSEWDRVFRKEEEEGIQNYARLYFANKLVGLMYKPTTVDRRRSTILGVKLRKLKNAKAYFTVISITIAEEYKNAEDVKKKKRAVNSLVRKYVQKLIDTDEDKMLAPITEILKIEPGVLGEKGDILAIATELSHDTIPSPQEIESSYQNIVNNQTANSVDGGKLTKYYKRVKTFLKTGKILTPGELGGEVLSYVMGFGAFIFWNTVGQSFMPYTFPLVLGGFPIPHCQEIEVARSGKILKFRATGSVFLANQEGGEDAIRVECLILPDLEYTTLLYLWLLFIAGKAQIKEIQTFIRSTTNLSDIRGKITDYSNYNPDLEKPSYEYHLTFPLVTRHIILPNVYIETLSVEDKIVGGKDVLYVSILLRTYRKPSSFIRYEVNIDNHIVGRTNNSMLKMFETVEYGANIVWRLINSRGLIMDESSWKVTDKAKSDDIYYNVKTGDLIWSVILGLHGIGLSVPIYII